MGIQREIGGSPAPWAVRVLAASVGSTLLAMMPAFMLGGLAVFVRQDLGFDRSGIGFAVSVFFFASMVGSLHGGRLAQRLGPRRGIHVAAATSIAALLTIAILAQSWIHLALALGLAGVGNAIAQPAANLALAQGIDQRRQGFAFGLKQSAVPLASLLAGLAVPVLALTVGWRWAFGAAAAFAALLVLLLPTKLQSPATYAARRGFRAEQGTFLRFALAGGLGTAGTTSLGAFLVESLVDREMDVALAGLILAAGSLGAIGVRLALGVSVDRNKSLTIHVRLVATMLATAAVGFFLMASTPVGPILVMGALIACVGTSAWQGLYHFAVVRRSEVPASATGVTQAGMFAGGVIGPSVFGAVASVSFLLAWTLVGMASSVAAILVYLDSTKATEAPRREATA